MAKGNGIEDAPEGISRAEHEEDVHVHKDIAEAIVTPVLAVNTGQVASGLESIGANQHQEDFQEGNDCLLGKEEFTLALDACDFLLTHIELLLEFLNE